MQTSARPASGLGLLDSYTPLGGNQTRLYYALREAVPIIDAAIFKTVRLTGGFEVRCADERLQDKLDNFVRNVPVGGNQFGLESFISRLFRAAADMRHGGRRDGDGYGRAYRGTVQLSA